MKQMLIIYFITCFCNAQDDLYTVFKVIEENSTFNYKLKKITNKNTDTIPLLKTKNQKRLLNDYQGKIVLKDSGYFIKTKNQFVIDIVNCIVNKDLAYVVFTVGNHTSIEVYLIRLDKDWFVKEVLVKKMIQLKSSLAKDLSYQVQNKIFQDIDKNIEYIKLNMTEEEILNYMGSNFLSIKDSLNKKIYNYSSSISDFVIHQVIFDSIGKVEGIRKYIDTRNW